MQLDQYNFDLGGKYCDQPIVVGSNISYTPGDAFIDENYSTENKTLPTDTILQFRFANYEMFISELSYFTISELDLKDEMWPIFEPTEIKKCRFDLPSFDMSSKSISINIVIVCDETYANGEICIQPDWISINSTEHSFSLLLSQVLSSGVKHIKLQAILVQMSLLNSTDILSTEIMDVYFDFVNSNIELIIYDTSPYVVFNQMKTFNFTLSDKENDELFVRIVDPGALSLYAQKLP